MLFVFAALLALVVAQCDPTGNTYVTSGGRSITFGAAVGDWHPGLINWGEGGVSFTKWVPSSSLLGRWEVMNVGSTSGEYCAYEAAYGAVFNNGCESLSFTLLYDKCDDRRELFSGVFTLWEKADDATCSAAGTELTTTLQEFSSSPLSEEDATFVFGADSYVVVSVGKQASIFQRWRFTEVTDNSAFSYVEIVDLASFPVGFACDQQAIGKYDHSTAWGTDCSVRLCGVSESCPWRASLFSGIAINDFEGDVCHGEIEFPPGKPTQCSYGQQWLKHPDDCVNQDVAGGCAFCQGVAMGEFTSWCINREWASCDDIFRSAPGVTYCNVAFECSASTATITFALLVVSLLAMLFH